MTTEETILLSVLIEIELWGRAILDRAAWAAEGCGGEWGLASQLRRDGVPFRPAWWEERSLSPAERQRFSRAVKTLVSRGLVIALAHHDAGRTTHLRLTPAGLQAALILAGESPDRHALVWALKTAEWAGPEHVAAVQPVAEPKGVACEPN
jgi:hypothetical protein